MKTINDTMKWHDSIKKNKYIYIYIDYDTAFVCEHKLRDGQDRELAQGDDQEQPEGVAQRFHNQSDRSGPTSKNSSQFIWIFSKAFLIEFHF